jgi:exodeoxyribonuclease-3
MTTLRILSWNINSLRLRLRSLARLTEKYRPDVVCLQEIKVEDALFPLEAVSRMGFGAVAFKGQKGYHGVAILSRLPFDTTETRRLARSLDARHLAVTLAAPWSLELHDLYVPAGGPDPNPERNPKFAHKLAYLRALARWMRRWPAREAARRVLVGDLNVAPLPTDVWSHEKLRRVVTHTEIEVAHLGKVQRAAGWIDVARQVVPPDERLFTWWSYRAPDWARQNKGRRLDHAWVSPALGSAIVDFRVAREARGWRQCSDHAPLVIDLALPTA